MNRKKVCWEKFARYFEVELKEVKLRDGFYVMDPEKAVELVDENTICVAAILGSTLNGEFEDVKLLNDLLTEKNKETGYYTFTLRTQGLPLCSLHFFWVA